MDSGEAGRRGDGAEGAAWPPLPPAPSAPPLPPAPSAPPPPVPAAPPHPYAPPRPPTPITLAAWLRLPRPAAAPGIWRCGHRPRGGPGMRLTALALSTAAACVLLCVLLWTGRLGSLWARPVWWILDFAEEGVWLWGAVVLVYVYYALLLAIVVTVCAHVGRWREYVRHLRGAGQRPAPQFPAPPREDPADWPELRAAGAAEAARLLTAELESGAMSDVDHARITHAWRVGARHRPDGIDAFVQEITARGAAAYPHRSGARDLPARTAPHDLLLRQVRIGTAADHPANPYAFRTAGIALDPAVLATSALAVGPSGSGKTGWLVRPVVESLCLQALTGRAAVVLVSSAADPPVPDGAFDVVVRPEDSGSPYGLDLYGTDDPDEAASALADALLGNPATPPGGGDEHRPATVLAQLTSPFQRVHGRLPGLSDLRRLLGGNDAVRRLRTGLSDRADGGAYDEACLRGLDALLDRHPSGPGDVRALLADGVALLDRPAFAGFFTPGAVPSPAARRPVPPRELTDPVRIRFDLPERRHPQASRILARLVLGQFTRAATARSDRDLFTFLVLDDAAQAVTARSLHGLRRLRSAHAGALLTLRGLTDEVPAPLCRPLLDAVGCRIACARLSPLDARQFAAAWHAEYAPAPAARRWTEDELTGAVPPGHAVLSCATPDGARTRPLLTVLGR